MKNNEYFLIQVIYWNELYDKSWEKWEEVIVDFGPFKTKQEMNAEMHRIRQLYKSSRDFKFTNQTQLKPHWRQCYGASSDRSQWGMRDIIGWKKIRSHNLRNTYTYGREPCNHRDGFVVGFWRTIKVLKQTDEEVVEPTTVANFKSQRYVDSGRKELLRVREYRSQPWRVLTAEEIGQWNWTRMYLLWL